MSSTIKQAIDQTRSILATVADSPQLEAEILLCHSLGKPRSFIHAWPDQKLDELAENTFLQLTAERSRGVPIAYLTGVREFWGLTLHVTPDTLIPRPETEHLVEAALARIPNEANWPIADLGTGSGAIALAIASERPRCQIIATDSSHAALRVAQENAQTLGLANVRFITSHWYESLGSEPLAMICSNPPYIAADDIHLQQGDLRFEPHNALQSTDRGLADLTKIIQGAPQHLTPGGWLILEHGYNQAEAVRGQLKQTGFIEVETIQDYAGLERISLGKIPQ